MSQLRVRRYFLTYSPGRISQKISSDTKLWHSKAALNCWIIYCCDNCNWTIFIISKTNNTTICNTVPAVKCQVKMKKLPTCILTSQWREHQNIESWGRLVQKTETPPPTHTHTSNVGELAAMLRCTTVQWHTDTDTCTHHVNLHLVMMHSVMYQQFTRTRNIFLKAGVSTMVIRLNNTLSVSNRDWIPYTKLANVNIQHNNFILL